MTKTNVITKHDYDIRDYIPSKDSVPYQLCNYLENQLGEQQYAILLDWWLSMPHSIAQWCYDQTAVTAGQPLTLDQMAMNLLKAINTAHEIITRYES